MRLHNGITTREFLMKKSNKKYQSLKHSKTCKYKLYIDMRVRSIFIYFIFIIQHNSIYIYTLTLKL